MPIISCQHSIRVCRGACKLVGRTTIGLAIVLCRDSAVDELYAKKHRPAAAETSPQGAIWDESANDDLFETAPVGYLEIDLNGIVRRVNRRECELRKLAPREMVGKHCSDLIPPAERQRYRDQIERRICRTDGAFALSAPIPASGRDHSNGGSPRIQARES